MNHKNSYYNFENQYRLKGYKYIAGLDEVGRGCWAGPLVAAAVILPPDYNNVNIKDSKQLSTKKREILFKEITENALDYQIVFVEPTEVDRLNPKQASICAMQQAAKQLKIKPNILLVDAEKLNTEYESKAIIKGDQRSLAIAAASILAKVTRD
jgi:ribonuclease HII